MIDANNHYWLTLINSSLTWHLKLSDERPPFLSLIQGDTNHLRLGTKGLYTNKKSIGENDLPSQGQRVAIDFCEPEPVVDRDLKKHIKHRLKSLKAALDKQRNQMPDPDILKTAAFEAIGQPSANALFQRLKGQRKHLDAQTQRLMQLENVIFQMEADLKKLESGPDAEIMARYKPQEQPQPSQKTNSQFKTFKGRDQELYLVGRNSLDNDELTRSARSDDYWLHARSTSGSHVIIRKKSLKEPLTREIRRNGGILALHFSGCREDSRGEVQFTQRRFLKKAKGAIGKWLVEKSETDYIVYENAELRELLNTII